ncbi:mesencephalic astrocyte-derived neurotrophic factor homolog [Mizuhopecten yessoensis]|uniref:mesencephalic astrocyte-derived neurotrophic factor homolog n=1 Tax=Mizuhopecten yessoensis TaxID=6573 RepID=UPI000B457573|nr:mesencephalic astrocyte-derived neurotrophic factor homolog [Mizuhopecten yessoensis]
MMGIQKLLLCLTVIAWCVVNVNGKYRPEECEACVNFIKTFDETLSADARKSMDSIKTELIDFCENTKVKEYERICYYIGGLKTSATAILNEITRPLTFNKPAEKICEVLDKKDSQICEVKIKKKINLAEVDLKKLRVKQLKEILSDWNRSDACKGCAEKSDFISIVEELMPKYDQAAYKLRQQKLEL